MITLLSMAATLMTVPDVPNVSRELLENYPSSARQRWLSGLVFFEVMVAPDGRIYACNETGVLGDDAFRSLICEAVLGKRTRIAKGPDGQPITALVESYVKFTDPDTRAGRQIQAFSGEPDIELTVEALPDVEGDSLDIEVLLAVDARGKVTDCAPKSNRIADSILRAACSQVTSWNRIIRDREGNPVPFVTKVDVRFVQSEAD